MCNTYHFLQRDSEFVLTNRYKYPLNTALTIGNFVSCMFLKFAVNFSMFLFWGQEKNFPLFFNGLLFVELLFLDSTNQVSNSKHVR